MSFPYRRRWFAAVGLVGERNEIEAHRLVTCARAAPFGEPLAADCNPHRRTAAVDGQSNFCRVTSDRSAEDAPAAMARAGRRLAATRDRTLVWRSVRAAGS